MSTWILVALSSVALFTTINFIDKYLLEDRLPDSYGVIMISAIISFCVGSIVWVSIGSPFLPLQYAIPLIASGLFVIGSLALYFYVLSQTKVSFVNIFFQIIPIFVAIGAYIGGERISTIQIVGAIVVIFFCSLLATADSASIKSAQGIPWKQVGLMLLYDLLWAGSALCVKYVGSQVYFPQIVSYESFGVALGGLLMFVAIPKIRSSSQKLIRNVSMSTLLLLCLNEGLLYLLARALLNYAYTLGSASIVSVLESTQIVFVLIAGAILSLWWPQIFRENTDRKVIIKKILYAINVIVGIGLFSR